MNLSQSVALITGGSSGIGLTTARFLAAAGAHVWLVARDEARLRTALAEVNAARQDNDAMLRRALSRYLERTEEATAAVRHVAAIVDSPSVIVNSAGIVFPGYVEELDSAAFRRQIEVNYLGAVYITKAALPTMLERRAGHIVNVCSAAGFLGMFGYAAYGASKYTLRGFSDTLRAELRPRGIDVSIVFPPDTDTPQLAYDKAARPPEIDIILGHKVSVKSPEFVARAILDGITHRRYIITPGLDTTLLYWLSGVVGPLQYRIMDGLVAHALRQTGHGRITRAQERAKA